MLEVFEGAPIVQDARNHATGGKNILLEFFKYAIVIYLAGKSTNTVAAYVVDNHLEPLETLGGTWHLAIGAIGLVAMLYGAIWEQMRPRHMGVRFRPVLHVLRDLLVGYLVGTVCLGGSFLIAHALGSFETVDNTGQVWMWKIGWYTFVFLFQAFGEEVMYRGAFMVSAARKSPVWAAVLVSSAWFSWHHHNAAGYGVVAFINLTLFGVLCCMTVLLTGRIWMATAFHGAWNMVQGKVLGVAVSGNLPNPIATLLVSVVKGNELVSGGDMGLEGSICATMLLAACIALLIAWYVRKHRAAEPMDEPHGARGHGARHFRVE